MFTFAKILLCCSTSFTSLFSLSFTLPFLGLLPLILSPLSLRVTEYISSLEHTHFSDGSSQSSSLTTITQQSQQAAGVDLGLELSCEPSPEASELALSQPVIQPLSIQELLRESSRGGRGLDLKSGSLMTGTSAAKAVCTLSTQADRYGTDITFSV